MTLHQTATPPARPALSGQASPRSDVEPIPAPTTRRNVKALTETLGALRVGDLVTAVHRTERYGTFRITGTLATSLALDGLVLAGEPLTTGAAGKPVPGLIEITRLELPEASTIISVPDATAPRPEITDADRALVALRYAFHRRSVGKVDPADVHHGEPVLAHLMVSAWGRFLVEGHAVALGRKTMLVGGWVIGHDQSPGARLLSLARLDPAVIDAHIAPATAQVESDD